MARLLGEGRGSGPSTSIRSSSGIRAPRTPRTWCWTCRLADACDEATAGATTIYNLAADMGGMGFIEANKARCMLSVLINTHLLQSALRHGVERFFFSSSACVYAADKQLTPDIEPLEESRRLSRRARGRLRLGEALLRADVPPLHRGLRPDHARRALPQRLRPARNLDRRPREGPGRDLPQGRRGQAVRQPRDRDLGRRRADAQLHVHRRLRRGNAARSWTSDIDEPINLGCSEMVTINQLVDIVEEIAGIKLSRRYDLDAPKGVRGRNSDNTMILERLGWEPTHQPARRARADLPLGLRSGRRRWRPLHSARALAGVISPPSVSRPPARPRPPRSVTLETLCEPGLSEVLVGVSRGGVALARRSRRDRSESRASSRGKLPGSLESTTQPAPDSRTIRATSPAGLTAARTGSPYAMKFISFDGMLNSEPS